MPTIDKKFFDEAFSAYKDDKPKFEAMIKGLSHQEYMVFINEFSSAAKKLSKASKSEVAFPKMDWVFGLKLALVVMPLLIVNATLWVADALCDATWFKKTRGFLGGIIGKVLGKEWTGLFDGVKGSAEYLSDLRGMMGYAGKVRQNHSFGFGNDFSGRRDFEGLFDNLLTSTRTVVFRKIQGSDAIYRHVETGRVFIPMSYTSGNLAVIHEIRESGINVTKEKDFEIKQCPEYSDWWILDPQRKTTEDKITKEQSELEKNLLLKLREIEKAFVARQGDSPDKPIAK